MKALRKQQDGIAHLLIIVLVAVVVVVIAFAAWWVFVKNKHGQPAAVKNATAEQQAQATAAQSACMTKYKDSDLCNFIAVQTASPFDKAATVITMTGTSNGSATNIVIKSDGKGNSQTSMTGNGQTYNAVSLNNTSYYQSEATGPWITYGPSTSTDSTTSTDTGLTDFMKSLSTTTYTKMGKEACGTLTCFKYQVVDSTQAGSTLYAWFDTKDFMLRQFYQSDSNGSFTMTIAYQAVAIPTPSPVQDMSSLSGQ